MNKEQLIKEIMRVRHIKMTMDFKSDREIVLSLQKLSISFIDLTKSLLYERVTTVWASNLYSSKVCLAVSLHKSMYSCIEGKLYLLIVFC